jgi:hypothetical protein
MPRSVFRTNRYFFLHVSFYAETYEYEECRRETFSKIEVSERHWAQMAGQLNSDDERKHPGRH